MSDLPLQTNVYPYTQSYPLGQIPTVNPNTTGVSGQPPLNYIPTNPVYLPLQSQNPCGQIPVSTIWRPMREIQCGYGHHCNP